MTAAIATAAVRLNLGCRRTRIPGFLNVDIRPEQDVDVVADAADLGRFADRSVEEIYASNILEHFPLTRTVAVLQEWRRVLVPGGRLLVSVPDFDCIAKLYMNSGFLGRWLVFHGWGEQRYPEQTHYLTFTYPTLRKALDDAGFSAARRVRRFPYGVADASAMTDAVMGLDISVNAVAVA